MRRFDIKKLFKDKRIKRHLICYSTMITMRREGIDITLEDSFKSYDFLESTGELNKVRQRAKKWPNQ
jgi:hypothetical protein